MEIVVSNTCSSAHLFFKQNTMKIFLDTAEVAEIKKVAALGILDGVTTNPSLIKKSGRDHKEAVLEICSILPDGAISAEVTEIEADKMIEQGRELAAWHPAIVVKIPMTADGLQAVKALSADGIRVNVTLIFSVTQAICAAKAGATYVSPFIGRLDDMGVNGIQLIEEIVAAFDNYAFNTEVLVASVRHLQHVIESSQIGADIVTIPSPIFWQMLASPLTDIGLAKFMQDAGK